MASVELDFNLDDTMPSMVAFVERVRPILESADREDVIDCSRARYIGPDAASMLYALWRSSQESRRALRVLLPTEPPRLRAFCAFSGLAQAFEAGDPPNTDHPRCETVPICAFRSARADQAEPVVRLVNRHLTLLPDVEEYLRTCVNEVVQNIEDHAHSSIGGVLCARFLSRSKQVRVAIVDLGRGIGTTVRARYPELPDDLTALRKVLVGGYSGQSTTRNMGLGLSNFAGIVRNLGGEMTIIAGTAAVSVQPRGGGTRARSGSFRLPGTAVFFRLHVGG